MSEPLTAGSITQPGYGSSLTSTGTGTASGACSSVGVKRYDADAVLARLKPLLAASGVDVTHFDDIAALAKRLV